MPFIHRKKDREPWFRWAERESYRTGLRHKIFYPKGGYYKGDWLKGKKSGKGLELLASGLQYEGDWYCDKKHGFGIRSKYDETEKTFHIVYLGDYKNNKKHGYGCMHYDSGAFYEGEFKNDKRSGFGRCWFADGSYYEGYWIKDLQEGYGMLVQANGNRYEGEWHNGKKSGWGVFFHLDSGQKQTGIWTNDICGTSLMEDIKYRQAALFPTEYPIPKLGLHPLSTRIALLETADQMLLLYNEGCQLHKYCYKVPAQKYHKNNDYKQVFAENSDE